MAAEMDMDRRALDDDGEMADTTLDLSGGERPQPETNPALLTSRSAAALGYLSSELIMARLGVYDPMATKELILRDEHLVGIQEECARSLMSLEILSLSHNKLTTLDGFQYFSNLIELNLNFNSITSLHNLQSPHLEKLFLSNNRITDIAPLKLFSKLSTLCMYGNLLADLEAALSTCRAIPKLRSLDLGGNPCSHEAECYKFQVVRSLPRLKSLDGEQVTQLDKDLAEEYAVQGRPGTADASRPTTATGMMGSRPLTAGKPWEDEAPPLTPSKSFDAFSSKHMPKGNVRLFRDDFLNNNPILLEYLAQETQESAAQREPNVEIVTQEDESLGSLQRTSSFVEKMRSANPVNEDDGAYEDDFHHDAHAGVVSTRPVTPPLPTSRPTTAMLSTIAATSNLGIDPSDPKTTIRKLLKHIEVLEESLAGYKTRQVEASELALIEENRQLRIENSNIPILQEEITSLKKQLSSGAIPPVPTSIPLGSEAKTPKELEHENEQLRREVTRVRQMLKTHEVAAGETVRKHSEANGSTGPTIQPKRLSNSSLLEESASIDVELTELILQNEVSLEMIRNDIKNTKKEWEQTLEQAKERERQRVRPQTSLGLSTATGERRGEGLRTSSEVVGPKSTGKLNKERGERRNRQLHTSAGFRHGDGPEEHLLQHATSAASKGRSATNILTL